MRRKFKKCGIRRHGIKVVNQEFWQKQKPSGRKRGGVQVCLKKNPLLLNQQLSLIQQTCFKTFQFPFFFNVEVLQSLPSSKFNAQVKKNKQTSRCVAKDCFSQSDWLPEKLKGCSQWKKSHEQVIVKLS